MGRILFFLLLALAVYIGYRWWLAQRNRPGGGPPSQGSVETMVRCEVCGLNLPQSDALPGPGARWYCGEAHRSQGRD